MKFFKFKGSRQQVSTARSSTFHILANPENVEYVKSLRRLLGLEEA